MNNKATQSHSLDVMSVSQSSSISRFAVPVALLLLLLLAAAPWWAGRADLRLMSEIFFYLSLASLWNLLAGYVGLVSVGQQAFVGLGAYLLFGLAMHFGIHPYVAIPMVGAASMLIALPVSVLIFRLQGAYFAIGTWVVAEVFRLFFAQVSSLGGGSGTSLPIAIIKDLAPGRFWREANNYWLAFALLVIVLASVYLLLRSKRGLALTAIRDNPEAAGSFGIDIWRLKLQIFVATAGMTAMLGATLFLQKARISPDAAFSLNDWTAFVIFIVVIGGIGTIEGPLIGTLLFFLLREWLADLGTIYLLILGAVAIFIMLYAPKGVWGWIQQKYGLEVFPVARKVIFKK